MIKWLRGLFEGWKELDEYEDGIEAILKIIHADEIEKERVMLAKKICGEG